jgi:carbonic anhydrase
MEPLLSPPEALIKLQRGNQRFASDNPSNPRRLTSHDDLLSGKQEPFAVILSCSDSRAPVEILFDQGIGDLFVVRVAGNVVGPLQMESIKFGTLYLHASLIVVLGHENCGAVQAVLRRQTKGIEGIAALIEPAVKQAEEDTLDSKDLLENAVKDNVLNVVAHLEKHEVLSKLVSEKKLMIVGGYYNLKSGIVTFLEKSPPKFTKSLLKKKIIDSKQNISAL